MAIDRNFGYENVEKRYPYILFKEYLPELALVLQSLPNGNIPVCLYYEESEKALDKAIPKSLELLSRLAEIQCYFIYISKDKRHLIGDAKDLLAMDDFCWE